MNGQELLGLASAHGTPLFVFDEESFASRMNNIRKILGGRIHLCYAIKANPFFVPIASDCADRLEVCSPGELEICKAMGVDPLMIVLSGVNKTPKNISDAIAYGVRTITAESLKHARLIEAEAERYGLTIDVLLRLNAGSQFGMSRDDLFWIVDNRESFPHIAIKGIHYFKGTQRKNLKHQQRELEKLVRLADDLQEAVGLETVQLEYGPGFGVPLFESDDFSDTLAPALELRDALNTAADKVDLTIEMGRFFATECGIYLTSVNDMKSNKGINYCIVDGGINHLTYFGQMMGMETPGIQSLSSADQIRDDSKVWCICGSLCTTGDVLVRAAHLGDLEEGDVLAFENAGAYTVTEGVYLFLSRAMPNVIIRGRDGECRVARAALETWPFNTETE